MKVVCLIDVQASRPSDGHTVDAREKALEQDLKLDCVRDVARIFAMADRQGQPINAAIGKAKPRRGNLLLQTGQSVFGDTAEAPAMVRQIVASKRVGASFRPSRVKALAVYGHVAMRCPESRSAMHGKRIGRKSREGQLSTRHGRDRRSFERRCRLVDGSRCGVRPPRTPVGRSTTPVAATLLIASGMTTIRQRR